MSWRKVRRWGKPAEMGQRVAALTGGQMALDTEIPMFKEISDLLFQPLALAANRAVGVGGSGTTSDGGQFQRPGVAGLSANGPILL
jgi:hypothetical protein